MAEELSKSARKRANQKARAAEAAAAEAAPPVPEPAPKSKAAAKPKAQPAPEPKAAAEPKATAKAKGKAAAAPKAAEAPPAPKAEAKAKAKGKAEPKPAEQPKKVEEVKAAEPKSKAAAKKAAAKAKAPKEEPEEPAKTSAAGPLFYSEMDDGKGDAWEVSSGMSKKQQRQKEKQEEKKAEAAMAKKIGAAEARGGQHVPGLAPVEVQVAQAKGGKAAAKAAVSQSVTAVAAVSAAAAANKDKEPEKAAVSDNSVTVTIKVPENKIGRVVGPKGSTVTMIKEKTGIKTLDMSGDMCTIVGPADAVTLAEHAVRQLIEKGYMALAFDDFEEEGVAVYPTEFPNLIGSKGAIIMEIKKQAKVEVDIPPVPKNAPLRKHKVMLAGSRAGVALGKEIINSIVMYGHHEVTHPGQVHQEMEVEEWRYRFLIGSKGSEMRHIQNNFKVKVNIPRDTSECKNVVIVGEPADVERAVKYIEKVMYESDQPRGRGAPEKAEDAYGDEGEVEDWMKPYMYQRK